MFIVLLIATDFKYLITARYFFMAQNAKDYSSAVKCWLEEVKYPINYYIQSILNDLRLPIKNQILT